MSDKKKYEVFYVGIGTGCYMKNYAKISLGFTWASTSAQAINNVRWRKKEELKELPQDIKDSRGKGYVHFGYKAELIEEKENMTMDDKKKTLEQAKKLRDEGKSIDEIAETLNMKSNAEVRRMVGSDELDYDSGLSATAEEFKLPPEGVYGFTVLSIEKTKASTGKKMVKVKIKLNEDGWFYRIYDNLVLTRNAEWKLISFFECIGIKLKGEPLPRMNWDEVIGKTGKVKIKHETYNGKEDCKVDKYLAPDELGECEPLPFEV